MSNQILPVKVEVTYIILYRIVYSIRHFGIKFFYIHYILYPHYVTLKLQVKFALTYFLPKPKNMSKRS